MSNLDYNLPEPTKAQLEYARYLSRFQAPRERRTLFARTESDIAAAFREETANHSWNADDLASQAGIDPRLADALLQRGEAPIEAGVLRSRCAGDRHSRVAAFQSREHSVSGVGIRQYAQRSMLRIPFVHPILAVLRE